MLRVFGPPEDLVKGIFHGSDGCGTQQRKARELEKKRTYAAELQAQMQEKERQKQLDRMQRLGAPPPGFLGSSMQQGAAPANFAAPQSMLSSEPSAWPTPAANPQQSSPATYQQQSPWQSPGAAAAGPPGCYNQGGSYGESPQVAPGAGQSPYSGEQQQQLVQSLVAWPDNPPGGGGAGPQYMMQQQQYQLQQPAIPGQGPGMYAVYQHQQPQQPYMAMSVAAQHAADTGSPSAGYYSSNPPQPGLYGPPGGRQSMAAAPGAQPWGAQATGTYSTGPHNGDVVHSIGSSSSIGSPDYGAPGMSPGHGYWGPGGMGSNANPAWGNSPAAAAAAAAGPDAKALAAKAKKDTYRAELEAQIRDKAARKAAEKSALAAEEARKEAELVGYNPWGRGGAGAPLRDANGQIVSDLRGRRGPQDEPQQLMQQQQQQQYQQQQCQQAAAYGCNSQDMTAAAGQAGAGSGSWGAADEQFSAQYRSQQQQQQQGFAPTAAGPPAGATPGAPPLLCFRSDKAFMTADEVERKQQAQRELQKELDQQIQEKKRRKELEQRQAAEEAQREEERLAAEQAKLAAQFEDEQMKHKSKARMTEDIEDAVAGAWTAAKHAAEQERQKSLDVRRRSQAKIPAEESSRHFQQVSSFHPSSRQLASQASSGRDNSSLSGEQQQQQQPDMLQFQVQQRQQQMDQQQRQQLMLEALRLEEEKMRQMAAQEVERLRSEMQAQASVLRDVMEQQGGEVAALRAAAAAAEAESQAAKIELAKVRRDFLRKSQELQHDTLSTILADYGDGPVSRIAAAYHPSPMRRIELDLPPHAATVRRSVQARAGAGGLAAAAAAGGGAAGYTAAAPAEFGNLVGGPSAVEVLESLLQQGKQPPTGSLANHGGGGGDCARDLHANPGANWGVSIGRSASLPIATAAPVANGVSGPSWLANTAVGKSTNVRSSMLVSESTFIFPSGLAPPAPAVDEDGNVMEYVGTFESMEEAAAAAPVGAEGSSWGVWQQQPPLQHYHRQTSSAPGSSNAGRAAASGLQTSLSAGRHGLVTPGGSDLTAVVNRNADKLQLLSSMPAPSDPEALDEFLAKFVSKSSQPNHRTVATPPSRLMTPPTASVQIPSRRPGNNSRNLPPRYSNSTADTASTTAAGNAAGNRNENTSMYLELSDTLNTEMSRMSVNAAAGSSTGAAAAAARQRLLSAGGTSAKSFRGPAAADGSGAAAGQQQQHVEASDVSMRGTSHWVPSNGHDEL